MAVVKIHRDEMEIVKEAANRIERRSNSRFVIDQSRVEISDDGDDFQPSVQRQPDSKRVLSCD